MATYELVGLNESAPDLRAPTSADTASIVGNLAVAGTISSGGVTLGARSNPLAKAISVAMTSATSGSTGWQVADNTNVKPGTGNFSFVFTVALPDWTPAAARWLVYKYQDASNYWGVNVTTSGTLQFIAVVAAATIISATSTVATSITDTYAAQIGVAVTRETASTAGSVVFTVNGVQLGTTVSITAAATTAISNTGSLYLHGTNAVRNACTVFGPIMYNRESSVSEFLSLYINGPLANDLRGSQTVLNTSTCVNGAGGSAYGTFSGASATGFTAADATGGAIDKRAGTADEITIIAGQRYRISMTLAVSSGQRPSLNVREGITSGAYASNATSEATIPASGVFDFVPDISGTFQVYVRNTLATNFVVSNLSIRAIGVIGWWNSLDSQSNTGQVFDRSGNKNHAMLPAAGAQIIGKPLSDIRQVRWTNTWAGTAELQYIGGVNQAILPTNAYIESIIGTVSGATVEDIIVGDGSDTDRYVTITTGLAAGTTSFTLANRTTDGTNLKLTVDPDASATMSIAWVISYRMLES